MPSSTFEMCRCCGNYKLPKPQKLIRFFSPGEHQNLVINIKNVITSCWEIQLAENDGHPQHICPTCFSKFEAYFSLRGFCRRNQNHLNAAFRKMTSDLVEMCRADKENDENNGKIRTKENTTNNSFICNKNKETNTGTKWLNAPENQRRDTAVKDFKSRRLEFFAISATISKSQRENKGDGVAHCKMYGNDDKELDSQSIEEPEYEKDIEYLENSDEINNQEIFEELNCNKETDHENHTTHIKQPVFQMETDCEVVVESEISQPEFNKLDDNDSLEYENTVSTDDEDYEENNIYQAETNKHKRMTYTKLNENPLECKYCCFDRDLSSNGVEFKSMEELDAHIKLQHDSSQPYSCQICKKNYRSHNNCTQHIYSVHKKKKTICWVCGMHFLSLKNHIYRCHTVADFECETCGKKFKNISPAIFNYHKRWHNKENQHKCTFCGKFFIQSTHLKTHLLMHTKDYTIKCEKCGKGFASQYRKAMHMHKTHGDALPIKCLYCEARFTQYHQRNDHIKEIHGNVYKSDEKFKCLKCGKEFRRESGLRKHMERDDCLKEKIKKKQIPAPKIKNYSCQECGRLFGKKSGLLMHIPLHSNEGRPFQCDVCQLHYKTNSHLEIHKRLKHSNEKPFACDICGKRFALKFSLNQHRRFHKV